MQLSNNIRRFRKERSFTQEQLAQALGVTAGAVYKWEAGLSAPDLSLLVELADLFDTSVDVLLGYEVKNNRRDAAAARLKDFAHRRDERGLAEADKLLIRYPNCFEIVYQSADLYWLFGFMRHDRKLLLRSIELMERACLLLDQNTDPEIGELSIANSIAKAYSAMGEDRKAVELFLRSNPRGVHNDFIGCILASGERPGEAAPYLSRALLRCVASLTRVVIGYFNVYFQQKDFRAAEDILRLGLDFFSQLKKPGQPSFLDKTSTELYVYLAAAQAELGDRDGARASLRRAKALAEEFDLAADYSADRIRFVVSDRPATAFDDMGDTAMECLTNLLEAYGSGTLDALWLAIQEGTGENGQE